MNSNNPDADNGNCSMIVTMSDFAEYQNDTSLLNITNDINEYNGDNENKFQGMQIDQVPGYNETTLKKVQKNIYNQKHLKLFLFDFGISKIFWNFDNNRNVDKLKYEWDAWDNEAIPFEGTFLFSSYDHH